MVILMEVKVTCLKCGQNASIPSRQVVRKFRCAKCSHRFVPVKEGIPCPKCGSVTILPPGQSKSTVICLECSFIFREPKWWLRRKFLILEGIATAVLLLLIFMLLRYRSNMALAKELRAEFRAWLESLPKVPNSKNGMLPLLKGLETFEDFPYQLRNEEFSLENESDMALLRQYLAKTEQNLKVVRKALEYQDFVLAVDWRKPWEAELPSLLAFKNAANSLVLNGRLAEYEGRKSEALKEYLNALRLGRTLKNEPALICRMIEVSAVYMALKPLARSMSEDSIAETDLQFVLEGLVQAYDEGLDYRRAMEGEYYGMIALMAYIIQSEIGIGEALFGKDSSLLSIRMSPLIYDYSVDAEIFRKVIEITRKVKPAKYYDLPPEILNSAVLEEKLGPAFSGQKALLASIAVPNLTRSVNALVEVDVIWRGVIALTAIRLFEARNGRLPKNLAELGDLVPKELLTDPFSGSNLIYRVSGSDFYLYSVGYDSVDGKPVQAVPFYKQKGNWRVEPDIIFHAPGAAKKGK